ncbi:DUF1311 domain-containing protein [Rubellimicrobium rubrum]|uniref:DUF1311 domain-containing protein n=1 Tax=Rubellimicrobium rubrum TaxID=2585369 RepID=A0A5C4MYE5_9RHOB|nr:lysozyme inhibitor LprI family protein [Rubellimicrobium rubrum]TNC48993.1 DUF1311 domain-containing protein [Rubellimicrobium rubrum]
MRLVLLLMAAAAGPALAQAADCSEAVTQADLNECAYEGWQAADRDLNDAYAAAVAKARDYDATSSTPAAEDTLREAQRAWVAYRDPACKAQAFPLTGGAAYPMEQFGCLQRLTEQRTEMLWLFARYPE